MDCQGKRSHSSMMTGEMSMGHQAAATPWSYQPHEQQQQQRIMSMPSRPLLSQQHEQHWAPHSTQWIPPVTQQQQMSYYIPGHPPQHHQQHQHQQYMPVDSGPWLQNSYPPQGYYDLDYLGGGNGGGGYAEEDYARHVHGRRQLQRQDEQDHHQALYAARLARGALHTPSTSMDYPHFHHQQVHRQQQERAQDRHQHEQEQDERQASYASKVLAARAASRLQPSASYTTPQYYQQQEFHRPRLTLQRDQAPEHFIGIYCVEERRRRLARFNAGRAKRSWGREGRIYLCRKEFANIRKRVNGRFVGTKKEAVKEILRTTSEVSETSSGNNSGSGNKGSGSGSGLSGADESSGDDEESRSGEIVPDKNSNEKLMLLLRCADESDKSDVDETAPSRPCSSSKAEVVV